jgi:16S rRNA U516 pseudouridylate synthase RsuA-like enzyme
MLDALGARIRYLKRVAFGPVELGDLPPGAWRELRPEEREALEARAQEYGG